MKLRLLAPIALFLLTSVADARNDNILLSTVKTLTLRNDQTTAGRRLKPISQLKCVGGDARGLYEVDVMRCINIGSDYGGEDVAWSCSAELPRFFKLGATDVLCEGYSSPEDRYVLKGSCGVEYRLMLTDAGYEKYGGSFSSLRNVAGSGEGWWPLLFTAIFLSFLGIIIYSAWTSATDPTRRPPVPGANGRPWFGGGGGNDPPPPYNPPPPRYKPSAAPDWKPGFWTGTAAGAAAGTAGSYLFGNRGQREERYGYGRPAPRGAGFGGGGSSFGGGGSNFAEGSGSGGTHESTGFGQTRRR